MLSPGKLFAVLPLACFLMAQTTVVDQIKKLPSPEGAPALATKLLQESRSAAAAAVTVWIGSDPASREKARAVLNEMEEVALRPLLNASGKLTAQDQVWRMTMVVETLGDLRRDAAGMLNRQLTNKQLVPEHKATPGVEGREPPRRVCDEAYMLMSQLVAASPGSEDFLLRMRQFLQLPEARRDVEIQRARESAAWRSLSK